MNLWNNSSPNTGYPVFTTLFAENKMKLFVLLIAVVGLVAAEHPLSDEFIEEVNKVATTWTVSC